ncbi:MAG TPA: sensor histidine kinase [Acidimicrobiales bacterium]|nr:sensor histidine kinase [Acidimicrobiales bacterium]
MSLVTGHIGYWWASHTAVVFVLTVGFAAVVWVVLPRQPRNAAVWALAASAFGGLRVVASAAVPLVSGADPNTLRYPRYIPNEHPASVAWLFMMAEPAVTVGVFVPLTFGLLLFPSGSLPARRWRTVGWFAGLSIVAVCVAYVVLSRPSAHRSPETNAVLGSAQFAVTVAMILAVVALVVRFRCATGESRQQCKWVLWGAGVAALAFAAGIVTTDESDAPVPRILIFSGFSVLIASYGVAIARYRLYDVDLVISRTIVYGTLAVVITAGYVGAVVGIGELLGATDEPNTALAITATAAVAATFQPLRRRLQRMVDRLVYGRKATPHEVLSEFSRRVSANDDRLLDLVTRSLVEGTGASHAEVWVSFGGRRVRAAEWPPGGAGPPENGARLPIDHAGVDLGSLVLSVRGGQRLSEQDRVLARQVASGMGLALRNRALTDTLQRRVAELRQSRRRLVALQDESRRRLERDLHDGAQQQLVALRVKLGLARSIAQKDGATQAVATIEALAEAADRVVDAVRDFARGVYPPLLEAEGLGPTIASHARRAPIPVTVLADGLGRYDREVESTVNACVVEALCNVTRHADASKAVVTLAQCNGVVSFEVRDDGSGFDAEQTPLGIGLTNLADRVEALAGSFSVSSMPGAGTTLVGAIPIRDAPMQEVAAR